MTILPLRNCVTTVLSSKQQMHTADLSLTVTRQTSRRKISIFCKDFFFSPAPQPPLRVVLYSPLAGFSLLDCEVS